MSQTLILKKDLREKLEIGITLILFLYYTLPDIPKPVIQSWALFGFITIPLLILGQWKRFIWVATRDLPMLLLIAVVPLSILWSAAPDNTANVSRPFLFSTAFGIYLATRYTPKEQMSLCVYFCSIFIFINLIAGLIVPYYRPSLGYPWSGITMYKNSLAVLMNISLTLFLDISIYNGRYRRAALIGVVLAFGILFLSGGKGSLGIFIELLPLLGFYKIAKQEYRLRTVLGICAVLIAGVIAIATLVNLNFIVVDILGKDLGGHGRDKVWDYLIQRGLMKPWLGYGYGGFWGNDNEDMGVAVNIRWLGHGGNAHNSYLETFLSLGYLGLFLLIINILRVLLRVFLLIGLTRQLEFFWMLQCLLIITITATSDAMGLLDYRNLLWILYVSITYSSAIHLNRVFNTKKKIL